MVTCTGRTVLAGNRQRRCDALSRPDNAVADALFRSDHGLSGDQGWARCLSPLDEAVETLLPSVVAEAVKGDACARE